MVEIYCKAGNVELSKKEAEEIHQPQYINLIFQKHKIRYILQKLPKLK